MSENQTDTPAPKVDTPAKTDAKLLLKRMQQHLLKTIAITVVIIAVAITVDAVAQAATVDVADHLAKLHPSL